MNGNMEEAKMKKRIFLLLASVVLLLGCNRNEIIGLPQQTEEKRSFLAFTEQGGETKTTLDGQVGDEERYIMWDVNDSIGISTGSATFAKFVNVEAESSEVGLFEGYVAASESYYAIYPYNKNAALDGSLLKFLLPTVQNYKPNSFGGDSYPMVSKKDKDGDFNFKNLCGVLVLRITGDFSVKSIRFTAKDANGSDINLSGKASVDMAYIRTPELEMSIDSFPFVVLDCGENGVQLDETESVPFHIVLPVGEYSTFKIEIRSVDGRLYVKEGTKPLTIKRSIATKTGAFAPDIVEIEIDATNLSKAGTANCYIVSSSAMYMIDASVIGNGYGFVAGGNYHSNTPFIEPASAALLWEEKESLISNVTYHPGSKMISFFTSGEEGNGVIAAKDKAGNIIWSWHIWCTDQPQEQKYVNSAGTFYLLDRNIGATRADRGSGDQWKESMGTLYFWGRKDPFNGNNHISSGKGRISIDETIKNPNLVQSANGWGEYESSWTEVHSKKLWSKDQKTIYDPCPIGYRVGTKDIWLMTTSTSQETTDTKEFNVSGEFDNGWNFYIDPDKSSTAWYPVSHSYDWTGGYTSVNVNNDWNKIWTANSEKEEDPTHYTDAYVFGYKKTAVAPYREAANGEAHPVRCMKDGSPANISLPIVEVGKIVNVTSSGATVVSNVVSTGNGEVIERGIVLGNSPDVLLQTGTKYPGGEGSGEFTVDLTELSSLTRYYVKAYATNADGTSYSQAMMSFLTEYDGEDINLSAEGTANSYIAADNGRNFIFDGTVKGNSIESVGAVASVDVVWETKNTTEAVSKGEIISTVSLMENGFVRFSIPKEYTPGNALIAVKDADGVILWSWHIWVADFDPVTTQQTYQSGAVMMDRNMGALNVQENDPRAYGFLYQWGRKDPMGGVATANSFAQTYPANIFTRDVTNSITEAIQNPTHFGNIPWSTDNTLWASAKTKYDPCPVGWRVPDGGPDGVWSGFGAYSQDVTNGAYFDAPCSTPRAFYPRGGYAYCKDSNVYFHGSTSYHWSCTPNGSNVYDFQLWQGQGLPTDSRDKSSLFNVRCQKIE